MSERPILTLDIGTRKVAGLLTTSGPKGLKILGAEVLEHETRAMLDGQIHDVVAVARAVSTIVRRLSGRVSGPIREVAVAAAGRALRTTRGQANRELSGLNELTQEDLFSLELEAVQAAQASLAEQLREGESAQDYHYVGHSVTGSRLDHLPLANLVGQRGNLAQVDVIATFLPRGVVDSLQAVLQRCDLEMTALTLEPIAALTVAVPQSMRHLNLALVDVGAGTSDIALTAKGAVIAYDMVPMAGDEITEALSEAFLLDFKVGEAVKRQIVEGGTIRFSDILGQSYELSGSELTDAVQPAAQRLASQIADRILVLNGGCPPQAILLVGGGSMTPGLAACLAEAIGLPAQRVAVRGRDAIGGVEGAKNLLSGPDAITPIGIAVAARDRSTLGFAYIHVNGRGVRLFHPSRLRVADGLLAAGIAITGLQGQIGKGLTITLNGSLRIVRGTFGRPAKLFVNEQEASLETTIQHQDRITVEPGRPGDPGRATVADVAPEAATKLSITVNGTEHLVCPLITVNNQVVEPTYELQDNDVVVVRPIRTVEDALLQLGHPDPSTIETVRYTIEGKLQSFCRPVYSIWLNGGEASPEAPLRSGDDLEVAVSDPLTVGQAAASLLGERSAIRVTVNGRSHQLALSEPQVSRNGRPVDLAAPVQDQDRLMITGGGEPPIFARLLTLAGISPTPPTARCKLVMTLNGEEAEFISPLQDGDQAEIRWVVEGISSGLRTAE